MIQLTLAHLLLEIKTHLKILFDNNIINYILLKAKKIKELGYPLMTYQVWTADKYLLGLERIPHSKHRNESIGKPVLLLHGLYLSSAIFTINNSSLSKSKTL